MCKIRRRQGRATLVPNLLVRVLPDGHDLFGRFARSQARRVVTCCLFVLGYRGGWYSVCGRGARGLGGCRAHRSLVAWSPQLRTEDEMGGGVECECGCRWIADDCGRTLPEYRESRWFVILAQAGPSGYGSLRFEDLFDRATLARVALDTTDDTD